MKKLTFALFCLLISISAYATESRFGGLGYIYEYVEDDSNILLFPGTLNQYKNRMILDSDLINSAGSLTLILNNKNTDINYALTFQRDYRQTDNSGSSLYIPDEKIQLMVGKGRSAFFIGVEGKYADRELEEGVDSQDNNSEFLALIGGYGYSTSGDNSFDLGIYLYHQNLENKRESSNFTGSAILNSMDRVRSRGNIYLRKKHPIKNGFLRSFLDVGYERTITDQMTEYSTSLNDSKNYIDYYNIHIGTAYETMLNSKTTFWAGVIPISVVYGENDFNEDRHITETDTSYSEHFSRDMIERIAYAEFFCAIESKVFSWLTARIAAKNNYHYSNRNQSYEQPLSYSYNQYSFLNSFNVYYGLGFHYKKFTMDVTINPDMVYKGPYFLSGSSTENFVGYLSMSYRW